jgi:hypothetical protein
LVLTVSVIGPVNPWNGVNVKTIPGATPPAFTVAVAVQGVIEKSGLVVETTSIGVREPSDPSSVLLDPA